MPEQLAADVLLTVAQVAQRLQVSEKWVRARITDQSLRATRLGRHVRVDQQVLNDFILEATEQAAVVIKRRRSPTRRA